MFLWWHSTTTHTYTPSLNLHPVSGKRLAGLTADTEASHLHRQEAFYIPWGTRWRVPLKWKPPSSLHPEPASHPLGSCSRWPPSYIEPLTAPNQDFWPLNTCDSWNRTGEGELVPQLLYKSQNGYPRSHLSLPACLSPPLPPQPAWRGPWRLLHPSTPALALFSRMQPSQKMLVTCCQATKCFLKTTTHLWHFIGLETSRWEEPLPEQERSVRREHVGAEQLQKQNERAQTVV